MTDQEKLPANNYTDKPDKPDKQRAIGREAKMSFGEKIVRNFRNIDFDRIKDRLIFEWLFPEIIDNIADGLRMIFLGDYNYSGARKRRKGESGGYDLIYDTRKRERERTGSDPTRQNFRRIKIAYDTRDDAISLVDDIRECLADSNTGYVTVKDFFSLANMPTDRTMLDWGWYDLEDIMIRRDGDEYIVEMPKAVVLEVNDR